MNKMGQDQDKQNFRKAKYMILCYVHSPYIEEV